MAKITPTISSRMPAVNSRRADNCSILGIPFCAKIVLHPVDVPGTNCNVPQGLSHCSGRHWCIQRHQKQCRPHLVGNIVFRHTTDFSFAVVRQLIFYFFLMRKDNQSNQKQNNKAKYNANTSANGGRYRHLIVSGFIREEHRHTICKATRNDKASF